MPMLEVRFAILLVILANKKLEWIIFNFVDWLNDTKVRKFKLKKWITFQFVSDQTKVIKHIVQYIEVC